VVPFCSLSCGKSFLGWIVLRHLVFSPWLLFVTLVAISSAGPFGSGTILTRGVTWLQKDNTRCRTSIVASALAPRWSRRFRGDKFSAAVAVPSTDIVTFRGCGAFPRSVARRTTVTFRACGDLFCRGVATGGRRDHARFGWYVVALWRFARVVARACVGRVPISASPASMLRV